ncbi:MAG: hypothetical protein CMD87_03275 [Gammaproteobacteria bacterium]|nr:hypothetical protein [Gammaproteobacteria bacterium]
MVRWLFVYRRRYCGWTWISFFWSNRRRASVCEFVFGSSVCGERLVRFERQIYSDKAPTAVLRLITDFRYLRSWDDSVVSVESLDKVFGEGSRYRVRVLFSGNPIDMVYTVSMYEAGVRAVISGVAPKARATDTIEVESSGEGTKIKYTAEIDMAFPFNLLDPLLAIGFKKTVDRAVAGLQRFLASQHSLCDESLKPAIGQNPSK